MPRRVEPLLDLLGLVTVGIGGTAFTLAIALAAVSPGSTPGGLPSAMTTLSTWLSTPGIGALERLALAGLAVAAIGALVAVRPRRPVANLGHRLAGRTREPVPFEFDNWSGANAADRHGTNQTASRGGSVGDGDPTGPDWIPALFDRPSPTQAIAAREPIHRPQESVVASDERITGVGDPSSTAESASAARDATRLIIGRIAGEVGAARARHRTVIDRISDTGGIDAQEPIRALRAMSRADPSLHEHVEALRSSQRHVESAVDRLRADA